MVAANESGKGPREGGEEPPMAKKKKKAKVAVSIRKGILLFFPTAPADPPHEAHVEDEPSGPRSSSTKPPKARPADAGGASGASSV
jgi:hypothetical protein